MMLLFAFLLIAVLAPATLAARFRAHERAPQASSAALSGEITTAGPVTVPTSTASLSSRILTLTDPSGNPTVVTLPPIPNSPTIELSSTSRVILSSSSADATPSTPSPMSKSDPHDGLSGGAKAGLSIGVIIAVFGLLLAGFLFIKWRRKHHKQSPTVNKELPALPAASSAEKPELEAGLPPKSVIPKKQDAVAPGNQVMFEMDGEPNQREMDESNMRALERMVDKNAVLEPTSPS